MFSYVDSVEHSGSGGPGEAQVRRAKHEFHYVLVLGFEEQQVTRPKVLSLKNKNVLYNSEISVLVKVKFMMPTLVSP